MIAGESLAQSALAQSLQLPSVDSPSFDWRATIISEYANSAVLLALIENMATYIDPATDFDAFYSLVMNVDTAEGYGLDVWGRIVGVSRVLLVPSATGQYLGFAQADDAHSFGEAPFYRGGDGLTDNFILSDEPYRKLILAKALANISDGSIPSINQILINLFSEYGNCYVRDGLDMTMTLVFGAPLTPVDNAIITQSGVFPRPAGVSLSIAQG